MWSGPGERGTKSGGGVVAEFFRDLLEPTRTRFSGGGGSSRIFSGTSKSLRGSVGGGGGVAGFFSLSPVAKSNFYPKLSDIRG